MVQTIPRKKYLSTLTQKILFVLAGASLALGGFMIWSPGTFGLCEVVHVGNNPTFGKLQFCEGYNFITINTYASPLLNNGLAILVISLFALFLPALAFRRFRLYFLGVVASAFAFIYLFPTLYVMPGVGFDIVFRNSLAWKWVLVGGGIALGLSLYNWRKEKEATPKL